MESLEQYKKRTERRSSFAESQHNLDEQKWCNQLKEYKMFVVVDQTEAREIEASARVRGAAIAFFNNLNEFYGTWSQDNEGTFMLSLNKNEGDPFHGKKTDSIYQTLNTRMTAMDLKNDWRLIRKTEGEGDDSVTWLYIVHL